jgi:hypothetical protein
MVVNGHFGVQAFHDYVIIAMCEGAIFVVQTLSARRLQRQLQKILNAREIALEF